MMIAETYQCNDISIFREALCPFSIYLSSQLVVVVMGGGGGGQVLMDGQMMGWMTCVSMPFSTVFQSYQDNEP